MTHYIVIIDINEKEKKYKVVNALVTARPGEPVYFCNHADQEAKVKFDSSSPCGPREVTVQKNGKSEDQKLSESGHYPFNVHVGKSEATASKPIIIIYD